MALTPWGSLDPQAKNQVPGTLLVMKGIGSDSVYPVEIDPSTGEIPITGSFTATVASDGPTGAAVPADASYMGMNVGGLLTGVPGTANGVKVDGSAVTQPVSGTFWQTTQPVSGTVTADQGGTWNIGTVTAVTAITDSLPAGSNTIGAVDQAGTWNVGVTGSVAVTGTFWQTTQPVSGTVAVSGVSGSVAVTGAFYQATQPVSLATVNPSLGRSAVTTVYNAYATTPVTTSAYVQLIASTSAAINRLYIADTSGSALYIATGGSGSEVNQLLVGPGGNSAPFELDIPSGTRISVKCADQNASTGALYLTALS